MLFSVLSANDFILFQCIKINRHQGDQKMQGVKENEIGGGAGI